jgi:hypothetical protein
MTDADAVREHVDQVIYHALSLRPEVTLAGRGTLALREMTARSI